jgi:hypothetical protein
VGVPSQEASDLEDAEALAGRVVGAAPLRDLAEAGGQDLGDLGREACSQISVLELGLDSGERIGVSSNAPEVGSGGEAEEVRAARSARRSVASSSLLRSRRWTGAAASLTGSPLRVGLRVSARGRGRSR